MLKTSLSVRGCHIPGLSFPRVSHLRSGKVPESGSAMPRRTFTKTAVRDAAIRRPGLFKKWPSTTSIFSRSFDFIVYIIMSISHIIGDVYCMRDLRVQHVRPAFLVGQLVFAFGQDAPAMLSVTNRVRSFSASIAGSTWFEYGSGLVIFLRLGCWWLMVGCCWMEIQIVWLSQSINKHQKLMVN